MGNDYACAFSLKTFRLVERTEQIAMKKNTIIFYLQLLVVGGLVIIGFVALSGEPMDDANYWQAFGVQILVAVAAWMSAYVLARKWRLNDKVTRTNNWFNQK